MTNTAEVSLIHDPNRIDFDRPGKSIYEVAFHYDGTWGNALVPMTVINGTAGTGKTVVCFGGTHGNEYEGQVALTKLAGSLTPDQIKGQLTILPILQRSPPYLDSQR